MPWQLRTGGETDGEQHKTHRDEAERDEFQSLNGRQQ